jgi:hypothetical protein
MNLCKFLTHEEQDVLVNLLFDYEKRHYLDFYSLFGTLDLKQPDLKEMIARSDVDGIKNLIRNTMKKQQKAKVRVFKDA